MPLKGRNLMIATSIINQHGKVKTRTVKSIGHEKLKLKDPSSPCAKGCKEMNITLDFFHQNDI